MQTTILSSSEINNESNSDLNQKYRMMTTRELDQLTNIITVNEYWLFNGVLHREDGPAVIRWDSEKKYKIFEYWCINGLTHRDGGEPAELHYNKDGTIRSKAWYRNGKHYRDNELPAEIKYYNGERIEFWYENDHVYRSGGRPAIIGYDENEEVYRKIYNDENGHLIKTKILYDGKLCESFPL